MLVESFEIQVLVIFYEFNKGFNQIRNRVFFNHYGVHWNIRGTLIQNTP